MPQILRGLLVIGCVGCGSTRQTDTSRAATEMLLVSQAIDRAVGQVDFAPMSGRGVFLDTEFLDKATVDRGYLVSSVRERLTIAGCLLKDDAKNAEFVVELRAGGIGTDRSSFLIGTPAITVPAVVPGLPTSIPEVALYKRNDQKGVAKIGLFAYQKSTGKAVWQSEIVEEASRLKDRYVFGSGPYSTGTIRKRAELAGEELPELPKLPLIGADAPAVSNVAPAHFSIPAPEPRPNLAAAAVIGAVIAATPDR
jgi:hypothetical protein